MQTRLLNAERDSLPAFDPTNPLQTIAQVFLLLAPADCPENVSCIFQHILSLFYKSLELEYCLLNMPLRKILCSCEKVSSMMEWDKYTLETTACFFLFSVIFVTQTNVLVCLMLISIFSLFQNCFSLPVIIFFLSHCLPNKPVS